MGYPLSTEPFVINKMEGLRRPVVILILCFWIGVDAFFYQYNIRSYGCVPLKKNVFGFVKWIEHGFRSTLESVTAVALIEITVRRLKNNIILRYPSNSYDFILL